ncbi:hypothetical protein Rs2_29653 [Raphanus sativus]|nr:hypothetical protein Rs2_29653 [Raphanus sativus]
MPSFPLANSVYDRPSMSVVEDNGPVVPWQNGASSKNVEEVRPSKIRRKMIDLCLPADEDNEEVVELKDHRVSSQLPNGYGSSSSRSNGLADLNEPFKAQDTNEFAYGSVREDAPLHPDENGKQKVWPHRPLRIGKMMIHQVVNADHYPATQPAKPMDSTSQPMQVFMNSSQRVMGLPNPNHGPPPSWRERTFIDLEADTDDTNTNHESSFASHQPLHLYHPPDSAVPWNHMHSSWQNPSFGFPQRVARYPVDNGQKIQGCLGDRLPFESNGRSDYRPPGNNTLLDLNGSEVKFVRDLNLNVTLSSNTCVVEVSKDEATLPWLAKSKSNDAVPSPNIKEETGKSVENLIRIESSKSASCSNKPETEKINNIPRDERNAVRMMLDINEPLSDADQPMEEEHICNTKKVSVNSDKCHIDLNMSVIEEEEEDENWSVPTTTSRLKTVDTHRENLDQKLASLSRNQARSIEEVDYFESVTLQLPETTEEEYMPKPLVPEDIVLEETSAVVTSQRPRRGNARKGKQRRDFQRDTLPGLVSLSKHEVTEDIQLFDGLMRAAGSSWTPNGLARKKTGSRGRPRRVVTIPEPVYYPVPAPCPSVQSKNGGEIEDGSFAGWGKMTRRPRRQRCPSSTVTTTTSNQRHAPFT